MFTFTLGLGSTYNHTKVFMYSGGFINPPSAPVLEFQLFLVLLKHKGKPCVYS